MAHRARNFPGAAGTDVLTSASTIVFDQLTSYYCRFNLTAIDATTRRFFAWEDTSGTPTLTSLFISTGILEFVARTAIWTGSGDWTVATPSTGAEHNLAITYDAGATTNNPVIYLDGSTVSVTT